MLVAGFARPTSSKFQVPSSKEAPSTKHQHRPVRRLVLGVSLGGPKGWKLPSGTAAIPADLTATAGTDLLEPPQIMGPDKQTLDELRIDRRTTPKTRRSP